MPFNIGIAYKKKFIYRNIFSNLLLRACQSGLLMKIIRDIEWEVTQRSGVRKVSEFKFFLLFKLIFFFTHFSQH